MKKVSILAIFMALVLTFTQVTSAQTTSLTAEQQDAQKFFAAIGDPTKPLPDSLKALTVPGRDLFNAETNFLKKKQEVYSYLTGVAEKEVNNSAQAKTVVAEIERIIAEITALKRVRDAKEDALTKAVTTSGISTSLQAALNSEMTLADEKTLEGLRTQEFTALLDGLNSTKQFYVLLTRTKSRFATVNSHFVFEDVLVKNDYFNYISQVRSAFQRAVRSEIAEINLKLKYKDKYQIYQGQSVISDMEQGLKIDQSLDSIWSTYVPPTPQKTDGTFTLTVDDEITRRFKTDEKATQTLNQINALSGDFEKFGLLSKDSIVSKASIRKAISLEESVIALYKQYYKRAYEINVQYESEYPVKLNLIIECTRVSDQDFRMYMVSVQSQAANIESPMVDLEIHKLALANFGKYANNFGKEGFQYGIKFTKASAQNTYTKLVDNYNKKYAIMISWYDEQNALNAAQPQS